MAWDYKIWRTANDYTMTMVGAHDAILNSWLGALVCMAGIREYQLVVQYFRLRGCGWHPPRVTEQQCLAMLSSTSKNKKEHRMRVKMRNGKTESNKLQVTISFKLVFGHIITQLESSWVLHKSCRMVFDISSVNILGAFCYVCITMKQ